MILKNKAKAWFKKGSWPTKHFFIGKGKWLTNGIIAIADSMLEYKVKDDGDNISEKILKRFQYELQNACIPVERPGLKIQYQKQEYEVFIIEEKPCLLNAIYSCALFGILYYSRSLHAIVTPICVVTLLKKECSDSIIVSILDVLRKGG